MKKRLRKKKHLNEFRQFGFTFKGAFNSPSMNDADKFNDSVISFVEQHHCYCGGVWSENHFNLFIDGDNLDKENFEKLREEFKVHNFDDVVITDLFVGKLTDSNYGPFDI
jgi:uncharacterized protein YggL (DUF469 family)